MKELDQRLGLLPAAAHVVEDRRGNDDDSFFAVTSYALWPLGDGTLENFAEAGLGVLE